MESIIVQDEAENVKTCIKCAHFRFTQVHTFAECLSPKYVKDVHLVYGANLRTCEEVRLDKNMCGLEGKWFKEMGTFVKKDR